MGQQAEELSYQVNLDEERLLWEIYWDKFTETERIAATDYYVKTIVQYKDRYDEEFLRRAANREYAAPPMR